MSPQSYKNPSHTLVLTSYDIELTVTRVTQWVELCTANPTVSCLRPAVRSVSICVRERPRTFGNWRAVRGRSQMLTKRTAVLGRVTNCLRDYKNKKSLV